MLAVETRVSSLNSTRDGWDEHLVKVSFVEDEGATILQTPIGVIDRQQKLGWHYSVWGIYFVKFRYYIARSMDRGVHIGGLNGPFK